MKSQRCVPVVLAALLLALAGCGDGFTGPETASVAEDPSHIALPVPLETTRAAGTDMEALALSAELRTAMTKTLTAALAELDIQPDAPMRTLHAFFQEVEAQQAERIQTRGDLLPTVQP